MRYIINIICLLSLSSCLNIRNAPDVITQGNKNILPLFVESAQLVVDDGPFFIDVPEATYEASGLNRKIDNFSLTDKLPITEGVIVSALALEKNIVFINDSGLLSCIDGDGNLIWQHSIIEGNGYANILSVGNILIVSTGTTRVYGVNPKDGNVIWKKTLKAPVHTKSCAIGEDKFAVITMDNYLYVVYAIDGTLHWSYQAALPRFKKVDAGFPVYHDDVVVLPLIENEVMAISAKDGVRLWSQDIDITYKNFIFHSFASSPVVLGDVVIVSNNMGQIEAFELSTGKKQWGLPVDFNSEPMLINDVVFALTKDDKLVSVDSVGKVQWISASECQGKCYGPLLLNGSLWLFSSHGKALEYDVLTGEKLSEMSIAIGVSQKPLILNGKIYLFVKNKELVVIGERDGDV